MSFILEFLLPRSDGAAMVQLVVSLVVSAFIVAYLSRKKRFESAWFAAGISCMWFAFMAFRTLH